MARRWEKPPGECPTYPYSFAECQEVIWFLDYRCRQLEALNGGAGTYEVPAVILPEVEHSDPKSVAGAKRAAELVADPEETERLRSLNRARVAKAREKQRQRDEAAGRGVAGDRSKGQPPPKKGFR